MNVYLASRYQDFPLMQEWAKRLTVLGLTVCSRWIKGEHEISTDANGDIDRMRFAEEDLEDITKAELFICRSDPSFFRSGRGGRHVELGLAIAMKKKIILIGQRENVFHWLPCIELYTTIDDFLDTISH